MNNKSLIKKLVEAFDFGKLKPKNQSVLQATMQQSLLRMNDYNLALSKTVDLGLPSGTLWCKFNVGATTETEYGGYFAWGETEAKEEYSWQTYKFSEKHGIFNTIIKYTDADGLKKLLPEDDAATVNMGKYWCIPTGIQFKELIDETKHEWIENYKGTGINGRLFTSKTNGNTLFFPAAGYKYNDFFKESNYTCNMWSSTIYPIEFDYDDNYSYKFASEKFNNIINVYRYDRINGLPIRAVFNG